MTTLQDDNGTSEGARGLTSHRLVLRNLLDSIAKLDAPREIMAAAVECVGRALRANRSGYSEVSEDGERMEFRVSWCDGVLGPLSGDIPLASAGEAALKVLNEGRTLVINHGPPGDAATPPAWRTMGARASISAPLLRDGRYTASLWAHQAEARRWTADEISLVEDIAVRCWDAVKRARAEEDLKRLNASLNAQVEVQTRQIRQSEALLRSFFERMQDGMMLAEVIRDQDGDPVDLRYLEVNLAWEDLTGVDRRQAFGRTLFEVFPKLDRALTASILSVMTTGEAFVFSRKVTDRERWYEGHAFRVDDDRLGIIFVDTTALRLAQHALERMNETLEERVAERSRELEAAEDALRQAQKMEALGQLTGGIAHDFNNLLAGIHGSVELAVKRIHEGRLQDADRYLTAAQGAATRAAALTQRLLAFSRRQTLRPALTDAPTLIRGMEDLIQRSIGPEIDFRVEGEAGVWPVLVDPHQLENALLNLCINARDAMPRGGRLLVKTGNTPIEASEAAAYDLPAGDYVALAVTDTGVGMSPHIMARAFDPFFTTKPSGQGTGLGLAMIYGFVRQSGGHAAIKSSLGEGTTVTLLLPRSTAVEAVEAEPWVAAVGPLGRRYGSVLVVDDEDTVRTLIADALSDAGYRVFEAVDGPSALALLEADTHLDLMISDIGLPGGLNGRELAAAVRAQRPTTKILLVTGYSEAATLAQAEKEDRLKVLVKPFSIEALKGQVGTLMDAS